MNDKADPVLNIQALASDLSLVCESASLISKRIKESELNKEVSITLDAEMVKYFSFLANSSSHLLNQVLPDYENSELNKKTKKIRRLTDTIRRLEFEVGKKESPSSMSHFLKKLNQDIYSSFCEQGVNAFSDSSFTDNSLTIRLWGFGLYQHDLRYLDIKEAVDFQEKNKVLKERFASEYDFSDKSRGIKNRLEITQSNIDKIISTVNHISGIDEDFSLLRVESDEFEKGSHILGEVHLRVVFNNLPLFGDE